MKRSLFVLLLGLFGCSQIPEGVNAVKGFDAPRYLGTWYEIARLDHPFERGLVNVSATYSFKEDGSLRVVNRGFDPEKKVWKEAVGRARFYATPDLGQLQVSFFGPFYGGYNILELDETNYSYALVCGNSKSYLWILARQTELSPAILTSLTKKARDLGFDTASLIYVQQEKQGAKKE